MKLIPVLAALSLSAVAVVPAAAQDVTIETYTGEVSVPAGPASIVALDVAAVDTLDALGVSLAGVPSNLFVDYLDHVSAEAVGVGTLFEPDYEALANLGPDLIVAGGRSSAVVDQLAQIAPTIDMTIWGDEHAAQVLARMEALAAVTGTEDRAAELHAEFEAKLEAARAAVDGQGNALIVLTNGPAVSAYGAGSRFGWLHVALDLPEAVEGVDVQTHGEAISFEFIAEADPDWLLVVDRGAAVGAEGESAQATLDNDLVNGTKAVQNGQVIYLNAANIYIAGGGIQSMMATLDDLIAGFGG